MKEMIIRAAQAKDAKMVIGMVREAGLDPSQLQWQQFLVTCKGKKIIGVGQLRRYGAAQELGSLVVSPAWRKKGIGAALINALVIQREGPLFLECRTPLSSYYEQFGFQKIKWYEAPWPLKAKFGLFTFITLFFGGITTMRYEGRAQGERGLLIRNGNLISF